MGILARQTDHDRLECRVFKSSNSSSLVCSKRMHLRIRLGHVAYVHPNVRCLPYSSRNRCTSALYAGPNTRHTAIKRHSSFLTPARADPGYLHEFASSSSTGSSVSAGTSAFQQHVEALPRSDAQRSTIFALSTPMGKAGVAVIRISGQDALDVWRRMVRLRGGTHGKGKGKECETDMPEPWRMHKCGIVHPESGELLDDGLAVFFKGTPHQQNCHFDGRTDNAADGTLCCHSLQDLNRSRLKMSSSYTSTPVAQSFPQSYLQFLSCPPAVWLSLGSLRAARSKADDST